MKEASLVTWTQMCENLIQRSAMYLMKQIFKPKFQQPDFEY